MPEAAGAAPGPYPTLALEGLRVPDEAGRPVGPLSLSLAGCQRALVQADSPGPLSDLVRVALAMRHPLSGRAWFMGRRLDPGIGVLARSAFYARVGLACELFGLVSGASVLDNLMTFLLYHREGPKGDLEARARGILGSLGFGGEAATANCALLGKPQRTLGLVALAIAKDPPLVILERPRHFLGPLFPRAWERLGQMGPKTATLVLALATEPHDDLDFDLRLSLKP